MSSPQTTTARRPQFDLWLMLEWTAAVAFVLALVAGAGGEANWMYVFNQLPTDDIALRAWLNQRGYAEVQVERVERSIELSVRRSIWAFRDLPVFTRFPHPPWQDLGYSLPTSIQGRSHWWTFSGSIYLWIVGFATLMLLARVRRRMEIRRQTSSTGN